MRKTKKYYRKMILKDYLSARSIINEAVYRYGDKGVLRGYRLVYFPEVSNNKNGSIVGFYYDKRQNTFSLVINWQGDSTDGRDWVTVDWFNGSTLKAELTDLGDRTEMVHGDVAFTQEQQYEAIKQFSLKYLK